jgi:A/G-specific adenine glycosylase
MLVAASDKRFFARHLLQWNREKNRRQMPWKGEKDPYKIWLSEVILQQTRVEQGLDYYEKFIREFPDINRLAKAPDKRIYKLWEGLGYYTRCKNLIATARFISREMKGKFPRSYEEIIKLKGVGTYTAAAIASFAYNLPYAAVDGNVSRVLSRVFGLKKAIDTTAGKKFFTRLAQQLLDKKRPGIYNQALMDFGATVCRPVNPLCSDCVFKKKCKAFILNKTDELPVKEKKIMIRKRWFYYLVMEFNSKLLIRQRTAKDIWRHLYEFALIESVKKISVAGVLKQAEKSGLIEKGFYNVLHVSPVQHQQLSHQKISGQFIRLKPGKMPRKAGLEAVSPKLASRRYAFPRFINSYLQAGFDGK